MTKLAAIAPALEMGEPLANGVNLDAEELVDGAEPDATDVAESAPQKKPSPIDLRKDGVQGGDPVPAGADKRAPVDLTKIPEFREWQAKSDQRIADAERRAAEAKRQADAILADRAAGRQKEILAALAKPGFADEGQIRQLLDEYVAAKEQAMQGAKSEWEQAKTKLISEAGLRVEDFPDDRYKDDPGTAWFRLVAEVQAAKSDMLAKRIADLEARVKEVPDLVKQKTVQAAADAGFLDADTGGDGESLEDADAEWLRDLAAVQTGKMSSKTYMKKWGSKEV